VELFAIALVVLNVLVFLYPVASASCALKYYNLFRISFAVAMIKMFMWLKKVELKVDFYLSRLYYVHVSKARGANFLLKRRLDRGVIEADFYSKGVLGYFINSILFTREERKKLMIVINPNKPKSLDYTPVEHRGTVNAPVLKMRVLGAAEKAKVSDTHLYKMRQDMQGIETLQLQSTSVYMVIAQLEGWSGVVTEDGTPVKFESGEAAFDLLPQDIQDELIAVFGQGRKSDETEARLLDRLDEKREEDAEVADEAA
jgi:hypothetical protein